MSIYLSRETLGSLPDNVCRPQYKYNDLVLIHTLQIKKQNFGVVE